MQKTLDTNFKVIKVSNINKAGDFCNALMNINIYKT